jgi:DNA-directed RNA polymerase specialized sigma24 family protein
LVQDILKTIVDKPPQLESDSLATLYRLGTELLRAQRVPPDRSPEEATRRQAQIATALEDLAAPRHEAVCLLRNGRSYAEIAREMSASMTETEDNISTALAQLLQRLD